MRAKSIKNKARVNAELSSAELKALLKKAQREVSSYASYVALLEAEISTWRTGGSVAKADWATADRAALSSDGPKATAASSPPNGRQSALSEAPSRPFTPVNPALELLKESDSRPDTPSISSMDKDEREDFLRRENELTDQLAEKVRGGDCLLFLLLMHATTGSSISCA